MLLSFSQNSFHWVSFPYSSIFCGALSSAFKIPFLLTVIENPFSEFPQFEASRLRRYGLLFMALRGRGLGPKTGELLVSRGCSAFVGNSIFRKDPHSLLELSWLTIVVSMEGSLTSLFAVRCESLDLVERTIRNFGGLSSRLCVRPCSNSLCFDNSTSGWGFTIVWGLREDLRVLRY